ncbi:MAG: hypothetical protein M3112_00195, partial [Actinomycetia bacterium]|nr:hypothetical protein [Actinomycetes bacterium]
MTKRMANACAATKVNTPTADATLASTRQKLYDGLMKEFSVRLRNRPGQLAALTMLLADAGV